MSQPRPSPSRHRAARLAALVTLTTLVASVALTACGGGDDPAVPSTPSAPPPPAAASTQLSGAVVKGPVAGATVCAYAVTAAARGAVLGTCSVTDASGHYSLAVPLATGTVWVEASGGSYTDESTAAVTPLADGVVMNSLVDANGASISAMLTPLTTLALNAARAAGGVDSAGFAQAAAAVLSAFGLPAGLDIGHAEPVLGSTPDAYGAALVNVSRMVAAGLPLATLLSTNQPGTLAAAYVSAQAGAAGPGTPSAGLTSSTLGNFSVALGGVATGGGASAFNFQADAVAGESGISEVLVSVRNGAVESVSVRVRRDVPLIYYWCYADAGLASAFSAATCQGVSVSSDGRSVSFDHTPVQGGAGSDHSQQATLSGTLTVPN